jgi:hypothetical protein
VAVAIRRFNCDPAMGLRTLIDCDWMLRRTGAVAVITGVTW